MREWVQQVLGNVTPGELTLVAIVFVAIVGFSWAPRIGATIGGWFERT